ncbi:MAG: NADH-quinone oxidoreductase subunit C [Candidatus Nanopelagicales bacterium]|jgi:NADH-quinone oxidoreductase subunit C|nr:NADH-quinone oxidoreductase subunit C [Candidatus Nanopelagicales bacterium]
MTWREQLLALREQGFDVLDWLSAIGDDGAVIITACVLRSAEPARSHLVSAPAPVASVADLFPSALWHERETAEMFGVRFEGSPDPRPLLLESGSEPPLRKDSALAPRLQPWPGAVDPAKPARTQQPPGTPWQ